MDEATRTWLRESLIFRINESRVRKVELATLPASMAVLAAQQVNEVRFQALEEPKDVGWGSIAFEFVLGFMINSSFMEKLAAKTLQSVYGSILSSQLALKYLPKSLWGSVAAKLAEQASVERTALAAVGGQFVKSARLEQLVKTEAVVARALSQYATLSATSKENLKLYAGWIKEFVSDKKNASALAKATKDAAKKGPPRESPELSVTPGASVAVVDHFVTAAYAQRLHVESLHNQYELLARTLPLSETTVLLLDRMFDLQHLLTVEQDVMSLDELGSSLRIRIEAMIWAVHLNFFQSQKTPDFDIKEKSSYDVFRPSINEKIVSYLFRRFGPLVERFHRERGDRVSMDENQTPGSRANLLRNYFWAITDTLS